MGKESGDSGVLVPCRKLKWRWAGGAVIGHGHEDVLVALLLCFIAMPINNVIAILDHVFSIDSRLEGHCKVQV